VVNTAANAALNQRVEELVSELQKMKAIILKHEVRLRDLEKKVDQCKSDGTLDNLAPVNSQSSTEANNNGETNLLPDEV